MKYFRPTDSAEDLKKQYKKLLTTFDYTASENAKLLNTINSEYKLEQANIVRRANENVRRANENARLRREKAKQEYFDDIRQRANKTYTKEEFNRALNAANDAIKKLAFEQVPNDINSWFGEKLCIAKKTNFIIDGSRRAYLEIRNENREYASKALLTALEAGDEIELIVVAMSKSESQKEIYLTKLEETLGRKYIEAYNEACEKYLDPITLAQGQIRINKSLDYENKVIKPMNKGCGAVMRFFVMPAAGLFAGGAVAVILYILGAFIGSIFNKANGGSIVGLVIGILVAIILFYKIGIKGGKKVAKSINGNGSVKTGRISNLEKDLKAAEEESRWRENTKTVGKVVDIIVKHL